MADSAIAITAGSGTNVDTRTTTTTGDHRQVVVVGDPAVDAAVGAVLNANPATTDYAQVARILQERAGTGTLASVAASATSVAILAANTARRGAVVYNDSTAGYLYLAYGATASLTAFTAKVGPGETFVMQQPVYTGAISGIWDTASGNARTTELT